MPFSGVDASRVAGVSNPINAIGLVFSGVFAVTNGEAPPLNMGDVSGNFA
jgi:hypothetical protein